MGSPVQGGRFSQSGSRLFLGCRERQALEKRKDVFPTWRQGRETAISQKGKGLRAWVTPASLSLCQAGDLCRLQGEGGKDKTSAGCGVQAARVCEGVGAAGNTWVSLPVHPDKLMGTCQRQNVWGECWQHKAQHHPRASAVSWGVCASLCASPSLHPCPLPPCSFPSPASSQTEAQRRGRDTSAGTG